MSESLRDLYTNEKFLKGGKTLIIYQHQLNSIVKLWSDYRLCSFVKNIFYSKRTLLSSLTAVGETEPRTVHEVYSNGLALPTAFVKYNNSHYSSDFDTSLHITNISFSDAGTYSCSLETDIKSFELFVIGTCKFSFIHIILSLCHWIWMYVF